MLRVIALNQACEGASGKRKRYNTNEHEKDDETLLCVIVRRDISVADCYDCGHCEIQSWDVEREIVKVLVTLHENPVISHVIEVHPYEYPDTCCNML